MTSGWGKVGSRGGDKWGISVGENGEHRHARNLDLMRYRPLLAPKLSARSTRQKESRPHQAIGFADSHRESGARYF